MDRPTVFSDKQYNMYELHAELSHTVTAGEASANEIDIAGVEAHAVVIADKNYARAYANDVLTNVTGVTYSVTTTTVAFTSLIEDDLVDIYFPLTGTASGSLISNTNTGKLTLPEVQTIQGYQAESNRIKVDQCGTKRKKIITFKSSGSVVLGLYRYGNTMMADFQAAIEGDSDGVRIPLLIDVVDTTVSPTVHALLFQATAESSQTTSAAKNSRAGIITDILSFAWVPDVVLT